MRQNRRKHTWMIAFAPYEKPTIALAILVEDGDSGGRTVAPLIRSALAYWFGLPEGEDPPELPEEPEGLESPEGVNAGFGSREQEVANPESRIPNPVEEGGGR